MARFLMSINNIKSSQAGVCFQTNSSLIFTLPHLFLWAWIPAQTFLRKLSEGGLSYKYLAKFSARGAYIVFFISKMRAVNIHTMVCIGIKEVDSG